MVDGIKEYNTDNESFDRSDRRKIIPVRVDGPEDVPSISDIKRDPSIILDLNDYQLGLIGEEVVRTGMLHYFVKILETRREQKTAVNLIIRFYEFGFIDNARMDRCKYDILILGCFVHCLKIHDFKFAAFIRERCGSYLGKYLYDKFLREFKIQVNKGDFDFAVGMISYAWPDIDIRDQIINIFKNFIEVGVVDKALKLREFFGWYINYSGLQETHSSCTFGEVFSDYLLVNNFLEKICSIRGIEGIVDFYRFREVASDPVIHLYTIRLFARNKELYNEFLYLLKEGDINIIQFGDPGSKEEEDIKYHMAQQRYDKELIRTSAGLFEDYVSYIDDVDDCRAKLESLTINNSKCSVGLEIESQNAHSEKADSIDSFESNVPITTDMESLYNYIKSIDKMHEAICDDIKGATMRTVVNNNTEDNGSGLFSNTKRKYSVVNVYDSVHLNFGVPVGESNSSGEYSAFIEINLKYFKTIFTMIGFVYNTLGRTSWLFNNLGSDSYIFYYGSKGAEHGYGSKLQSRYWCFYLREGNADITISLIKYIKDKIDYISSQEFNELVLIDRLKEDIESIRSCIQEFSDGNSLSYYSVIYGCVEGDGSFDYKKFRYMFGSLVDAKKVIFLPHRRRILDRISGILSNGLLINK